MNRGELEALETLTPRFRREVEGMNLGWKKGQEVVVRGFLLVHGCASQIVYLIAEYQVSWMHSLEHFVVDHQPVFDKLGFC